MRNSWLHLTILHLCVVVKSIHLNHLRYQLNNDDQTLAKCRIVGERWRFIALLWRWDEVERPSCGGRLCESVLWVAPAELWFSLGVLLEGHWNTAGLCRRLEQSRLCVQCPGRDLARHTPFWESCGSRSQFPRRLYQPRQRAQGGSHLRSVRFSLLIPSLL